MFDSVGKSLDEDAAKRSAQSVVIAMFVFAAGLAGATGYAAWQITDAILNPDFIEDDMIAVELVDEPAEELLAPPPPPPPPPSAAPEEEEDEDEEDDEEEEPDDPEPDEVLDEVAELDPEPDKTVKNVDKPKGQEGGVEGGVEGGDAEHGVVGGQIGGVPGGTLGPKAISRAEVQYKKKPVINYPAAAEQLGLGQQRCMARVYIDTSGVPYQVDVTKCPKIFHRATKEGVLKARWYPFKVGKTKIPVQFLLGITYVQPR